VTDSSGTVDIERLVTETIDTYEAMIERARLAGKRKVSDQKAWAAEATKTLIAHYSQVAQSGRQP